MSTKTKATVLESPDYSCPSGYLKSGGDCVLKEYREIIPVCPNGYTPKLVYEESVGIPVNTCVASLNKTAEVICSTGWETGGTHNQQCRHEKAPDAYGNCAQGYTKSGNICVTPWEFQQTNKYVCADLCDDSYTLPSPTSKCPAEYDPIEIAKSSNAAICGSELAAEGKCVEGQTVYVTMPEQEWVIENPLQAPSASNPVMCYRKHYESQKRECPTPNSHEQSNGEPIWEFPSGIDADNPSYWDEETGEATHCMRTSWADVIVECKEGQVFDPVLNGCMLAESLECPEGTQYSNGQCLGGDGKQCPKTHEYDEKSAMCVPKLTDPNDFDQQYRSGADLAWAIGGLQNSKKQQANSQGDVTLSMGLLNQEADANLQSKADDYKNVVAIGENDRTHNQYASINQTFGDERNQTSVIQTNHASYTSYLNDPNAENQNLAAEAYALVDDTIDKNRPPEIDPNNDWLDNSRDIIEGIGNGTDPYFGDCEENGTKKVLNPDKQIVTQHTCTQPVVKNFSSCEVSRYIEEPVLKIIEGADKAEVEIIANDKIRITMGEICDNCLNDGGTPCKTYQQSVVVQMMNDVQVIDARFKKSLYDDMIVIAADGNEVFRAAKSPWDQSGWPAPGQSCENGTSYTWNGDKDVTTAFQDALANDNRIDFNYKIGVGGGGEAHAVVEIQFDRDIRTDWYDEPRYQPEDCFARYQSGECTASSWECDIEMPPQTLGMEHWEEWDGVKNWNITNQGYDARSTQNGPFSAYGSMTDVGELWFKGDVTVPSDDDDSFGFMIGYPEEPYFNKDPNDSNYNPNADDDENNHYYVLLWTSNHGGSNGSYYGLSFYKSYVPYSTLESRFPSYWGINFHSDMYETDRFGNNVKVLDVIQSDRSPWSPGRKYEIEYKQDQFGYIRFWIDSLLRIEITPEIEKVKTGRFGFATISLNNVLFEGMEKIVPYDFGPLFPGDSDPSKCIVGHAKDFRCGVLASNNSILGPHGSVWNLEDIKNQEDTCEQYSNREDCSWAGRECVEGFEQPDGSCLMEQEVWECVDNSQAWEEVPMETTCDFLPCSDGNCEHRGDEENTDFGDAITQIGIINEMKEFIDCSDPDDVNTCQVYRGEKRVCSYDQFGMIDCCEEFKGKTLDLFAFTTAMFTVMSFETEMNNSESSLANQAMNTVEGWLPEVDLSDSYIGGIGQEIDGLYTDVKTGTSEFVDSAWEAVGFAEDQKTNSQHDTAGGESDVSKSPTGEDGMPSTSDRIMDMALGMIKGRVIESMVSLAVDLVVQMLPEMMQQAVLDAGMALASEQAAKELTKTATEQSVEAAAQEAATQMIGQMVAFMGMVSMAMAIISIAQMLYQLLNGCEESEMDMPQILKEKRCFYGYTKDCNKKLGICTRKYAKQWCCFSSLMSKLIMEQATKQPNVFGGRSYSNKEWITEQNCRGLTLGELPLVDFNEINLDEWYDLMVQSGALPDGTETLEEWTQENSLANPHGRIDSLTVQESRGLDGITDYHSAMDAEDVMGQIDCSQTSNSYGCRTGILDD
ncbi:conjugal transfer protein TraN [Vibrio sp. 10N.239.312.D08]|uniref:conjugal transfer protein TraN n=1 Tax=Vibrio sp. 10N.239.312.D08 TaxID=3229978 RepID=UPI0035515B7A